MLLLPDDWPAHKGHGLIEKVTRKQLRRPSTLLPPIENKKTNAVCVVRQWLLTRCNELVYLCCFHLHAHEFGFRKISYKQSNCISLCKHCDKGHVTHFVSYMFHVHTSNADDVYPW